MGEKKKAHADEVAALRLGIDLGMALIDAAEMYGDGGAEEVVAAAIAGQRDRVLIIHEGLSAQCFIDEIAEGMRTQPETPAR